MVGDVLSESTVGEVVPQLEQQLVRIAHIIGQYRAKQQEKEVELRSFLEKHGMLSTAQQVQQGEKDKAAKTAELKGAGILAWERKRRKTINSGCIVVDIENEIIKIKT